MKLVPLRKLVLLPLVALTASCSTEPAPPPTQLVVSVSTDMEVPKDIDHFGIEVLYDGATYHSDEPEIGPLSQVLPATFTVVAGADPSVPFTVRVHSRKSGVAKTFREVVTTFQRDRVALLPIKIQWLCWNQVNDLGLDLLESTCPSGQTCVAGTCADAAISSDDLPDYSEEAVFGGAPVDEGSGECLDTVGCFSSGNVVAVDTTDCTIDDVSGGEGANVALVLPPQSPGICGPEACLIPLDANSAEGWRRESGRIALPPAACDRPGVAVAVTTACAEKTEGIPTCGAWSAVPGSPQNDLGAPADYEVPVLDAGGAATDGG